MTRKSTSPLNRNGVKKRLREEGLKQEETVRSHRASLAISPDQMKTRKKRTTSPGEEAKGKSPRKGRSRKRGYDSGGLLKGGKRRRSSAGPRFATPKKPSLRIRKTQTHIRKVLPRNQKTSLEFDGNGSTEHHANSLTHKKKELTHLNPFEKEGD